jgi:hypothetical protein
MLKFFELVFSRGSRSVYLPCGRRTGFGVGVAKAGLTVHKGVGVRVGVEAGASVLVVVGKGPTLSVDVGSGAALAVNNGSRQTGIESTRAAGSRVWPN